MQIAAHDVGTLSRVIGGFAGATVAAVGASVLLASSGGGLPAELRLTALSLGAAGATILVLARSRPGRGRRVAAGLLAALCAGTALAGLPSAPAAGLAAALVGAALVLLAARADRPEQLRRADPVLASAALLSVSALVSWVVGPAGAAFPWIDGAVLALTAAAVLVSPEGRLPGAAGDQPAGRRELADTLLESMNEAVMVLDANHRVIDVNRRWRELTGHRTEDAVGRRPPFPWVPDADDDQGAGGAPAGNGDRVLQRIDGTGVPVLATMAAVPDAGGRPRAYVATYVDIADRKRVEEALAQRAIELEASNARLREANVRLETALAFKTDVMSMLSHDVAQPISSIASLAELLTSDWADLPDDVRLELATKIDRNTQRLIRMMSDLSLLFRLDTGSVTARRTPVGLREVAESVVRSLTKQDVEIRMGDEVSALADRGHLVHVVTNLVSNALKYGGPPVEISAGQQADRIVLVVQDRGPGIAAELVPNLFDRFMRGSGLGLFIVRHLVEANGGDVRYEAGTPQGARLVVSLEPAALPIPGGAPGDAGERKTGDARDPRTDEAGEQRTGDTGEQRP